MSAADIAAPICAAVVLMCAMYLPTIWYGRLLNVMGVPQGYGEIELDTVSSVVMIIIASVFFAPICEETVYRGVLLHGLRRESSAAASALLCALSFMLMHMNPLQVVFQFALGVTAAFFALRSGKLLPAILLHAACNALALAIDMTPLGVALSGCVEWLAANPAAAVFITLGFMAAGGGILFLLLKLCFPNTQAVKEEDKPIEKTEPTEEKRETVAGVAVPQPDLAAIKRDIEKKNGSFKYYVALSICGVMFAVNLVQALWL